MNRLLAILFIIIAGASAQKSMAQGDYVFKVKFKDKAGTTGSFSFPSDYLSPRAISKKSRLGVILDSTDLPPSKIYIDSLLTYPGLSLHGVSKWMNTAFVVSPTQSLLSVFSNLDFVESAVQIAYYPNGYGLAEDTTILDSEVEPIYSNKSYNYGHNGSQIQIHNGQQLHLSDFTGSGMLIAILDDGFTGLSISPAFTKLRNENRVKGTYNYPNHNSNIEQGYSHGTKVLAQLAAEINGTYVGAAPDADYILLATEDSRSEQLIELENWIMGLEFADSMGVDVVSSSVGYNTFDNFNDNLSQNLLDGESVDISKAASMAADKGIIVVTSAGNEGSGSNWNQVLFPADAKNILTVGGVNSSSSAYTQGGHGMTVDGRIKPDVASIAVSVSLLNPNGTVSTGTGNSYSTPTIAGLVACLWQVDTMMTAHEVMDSVRKYSSNFSNPNQYTGYGIPDFGTLLQVLNIKDLESSKRARIYPNPVRKGSYTVNLFQNKNIKKLVIVDVNGRLVETQVFYDYQNTRTIKNQLKSGSYILLIYTDQEILYKRLTVD